MAPGSGTTSFAVTHPVADRYNVVAPWGRVVATFSTTEDGALAEAFAQHHARLETATLHLAAEHMEIRVAEVVMAFEAAYDALVAEWAGEAILEVPASRGVHPEPIRPRPCMHNGYHQPGRCPEANQAVAP
jgi:hypothetical protein